MYDDIIILIGEVWVYCNMMRFVLECGVYNFFV
mgnify:FL=1